MLHVVALLASRPVPEAVCAVGKAQVLTQYGIAGRAPVPRTLACVLPLSVPDGLGERRSRGAAEIYGMKAATAPLSGFAWYGGGCPGPVRLRARQLALALPLQDGNLESIPAAGVTYTVEMDMVLTRG